MADEKEKSTKPTDKKSPMGGIFQWIILGVIVVVCSGSGMLLGRLLAGGSSPPSAAAPGDTATQAADLKADKASAGAGKVWYYEMDAVVANLNEPSVTRYVRASLILEISGELDEKKAKPFFDERKPILTNWLTIYLASLTLEDIRGHENQTRIQTQILDAFNEKLFPNSKPQIKSILFKEFAVQ
jgi:flagellar basal body-associated protein FliL